MSVKKKKVAIIGAGITGLSCAYFLQKGRPDLDITIIEAQDRVGGWIKTNYSDGDPFECGPRSFRVSRKSASLLQMIHELGLDNEIIVSDPAAKRKYLARDGMLVESPRSLKSLIATPLGRKVIGGLWRDLAAPRCQEADETVASFFCRRFGQDVVDTFIDPFMAGIYAAGPELISMRSAFKDLCGLEKKYRSVVLGAIIEKFRSPRWSHPLKGSVATFKNGMETLPQSLLKALTATIHLNTKAMSLRFENGGAVVDTTHGVRHFDFVVSTTHPSWIGDGYDVPVSPMASVAAISFGYKKDLLAQPGFGFLCSRDQEHELLGCIFDSCVFPDQAQKYKTKVSIMMGGSRSPEVMTASQDQLVQKARDYCKKYLGIADMADIIHVTLAHNAIASYPVHHQDSLEKMERRLHDKPLRLVGAPLYGVSLSDCAAQAHTLVESLF